ncbi:MAG: tRNA (guanine-N7-)-methyltransferase [Campylobacterota bacterium]|nr:tRNA (guanine-N7-)-methyltransferase [Campylobacterota bacterium]
MPHALVESFEIPKAPFVLEGVEFEFISLPYKNCGVVGVKIDNHNFLLKYIQNENKTLIKYDKATRIPKLNIIKRAINSFCNAANSKKLHSNTVITRKDPEYKNYKNIDFFLEEFNFDKEIWIEIGFGSGRHMLHNAKNNPSVVHIGLEIHKASAEQVLKQCMLQNIDNVYINDSDARMFLEMLPANSVSKIFIHFPVPWDKAPHRRVISKNFINEAVTVLKEGGRLELRTDSKGYADYTYSILMDLDFCELSAKKNHFIEVSSKYEDRWKKEEKDFYDLVFINHKSSDEKEIIKDFSFSGYINYEDFLKNAKEHVEPEDGFFVSAKEKYPLNAKDGLVKVTMGTFNSPQSLYLLFKDGKISYYPKAPYPTKANFLAHKKLEAIIGKNI